MDIYSKRKLFDVMCFVFLTMTLVSGCMVVYDCVIRYQEAKFWDYIRESRKARIASYNNIGEMSEEEISGNILHEYEKLYVRNRDMVGWIDMERAGIDFPVMQTKNDPEYYLRRNFDRHEDTLGVPFIDYRCELFPCRSFNLILYGHYSDSDCMFRRLLDYADEEWALDNRYITFDTLRERGTYEVVAAFYYNGADAVLNEVDSAEDDRSYEFYNYIELDSREGFERFLDGIKAISMYESEIDITPHDKLLTIVCCAPEAFSGIENDGRFVVVAKKVDK